MTRYSAIYYRFIDVTKLQRQEVENFVLLFSTKLPNGGGKKAHKFIHAQLLNELS